jgi:quercetin dioxygenase-like cupin family protein
MDAQETQRSSAARTHGSDQRPPRDLHVAFRGFDVGDLAARLSAEPAFRTDGRNSEMVHDDGRVRVLVSVVAAGREIGAERSDGYVTLSMIQGTGWLTRGTKDATWLRSGTTAILAPGASWSLYAEDTSVLMAYFWAQDDPDRAVRDPAEAEPKDDGRRGLEDAPFWS